MGKPSVTYRLRFLLIRVITGNFFHFVPVFSPSKEKQLTDPIYALVHSTHFISKLVLIFQSQVVFLLYNAVYSFFPSFVSSINTLLVN